MKKYLLCFGMIAFVLTLGVSGVFADDNAFTKLGRGMANIVISPAEVYTQSLLLTKDNEASVAVFGGIGKGVAMFVVREFVGVYDVLTFPFPVPAGYRPLIEPATTFTDWENRKP